MKKFCTTIGNFDGLHIGHKAMITEIINKSKLLDLSSQVITFNPYPFEHFKFDKKRILGDRDKPPNPWVVLPLNSWAELVLGSLPFST